jgi:uncharacterized membrane protein
MTAAELAAAYGLPVEYADLGDWNGCALHSEYDPNGPVIRVNTRSLARLSAAQREEFVELAIGHELYHHRERVGEITRVSGLANRERAAHAFARALRSKNA